MFGMVKTSSWKKTAVHLEKHNQLGRNMTVRKKAQSKKNNVSIGRRFWLSSIDVSFVLPLSITCDTASKGFRTLVPWNVTRLEMSPPPCCSVRTFTVHSPKLSNFSSPGPTYRCPFTWPFEGFRSTLGQSSGFTTVSPAPESTVISRNRPRLPPVSTALLSMDMLPIVTAFSSTWSGHHR